MNRKLYIVVMFITVFIFSCVEEKECETEESCFTLPDGSKRCFEKPSSDCFNNNDFGF